jgi:site-specific recombinase XerC
MMADETVKDVVRVRNACGGNALSPAQFGALAEAPAELEFIAFAGLQGPSERRSIARTHVIACRKKLEKRELADSTIRRKLSALSALFDYLCERNAVARNPVAMW